MTRSPLVFIIILNWNGWRDTLACVESCRRLTWPNYRIVVVDNSSTDGSEEFLRRHLRDEDILQSGSNLGFAGGCNVGIRHALSRGADYIWLLNNDTVADPEALTLLVAAIEREKTVGIAGSKIYYHDDPRRIWSAGGIWEKGRLRLYQRGAHKLDEGQFEEMCEAGSLSGCSMLISTATIKSIGLMDESYFLYWEDTEWCARALEKGYKILFVPGSRIWHKVSASAGGSSFSQYYYYIRNGFYFLCRYDPKSLPRFILFNLLYAIYSITKGNVQVIQGTVQGFVDFMRRQKGPRRSTSAKGAVRAIIGPHAAAEPLAKARILLLFPHMVTPGGALNYTLRLAELLLKRGATVAILTMQADRKACSVPPGLEVISLDGPLTSSLGYWLLLPYWQAKINRRLRRWHPDVLVPQVFPANWWGWLYKQRNRETRIVWFCPEPSAFIHSRNWINALKPFWNKYLALALNPILIRIDIRLSRFSDKIIANSNFTAGMIEKVYRRKADAVAYPAIDFREFHPGDSTEKQEAIITVANLSRFKRVDFLLRVFSLVLKQHPHMIYHIVGRGEDEDELKDLARKLHISANVIFHGRLDNEQLAVLYRCSLLFLHGSVEEPFGMAPLEAIACGTPVVAHKSGGPLEFVNENCGRLIASLNVEDWAREITGYLDFLFAHGGFPDQVRECARHFDWSLTLQPAVDIIAGLCAEGARVP